MTVYSVYMNETRRVFRLLILIVLILILIYALLAPSAKSEGAFVAMLDVGQGDSFLIQAASGKQMLIDGGRDASTLTELDSVMPKGDRSIDVLIATHPDADHIGGLPEILRRYKVGIFITSQVIAETEVFEEVHAILDQKNIPSYYARRGMVLTLDKKIQTTFSILFPDRDTSGWETNTTSIIGRLDIGEASMLFTGDSPISVEQFLVKANPNILDVDVLKIGHHGSKTSTSDEFLKATTPELALISAGIDNQYGHPSKEVLENLEEFHIPWKSTQSEGTFILRTDGTSFVFEE